jgi:hypothetical protein
VAGKTIRLSDAQAAAHLQTLPPQVVTSLRVGRLLRTMRQGPAEEIETFHDRIRESVIAHLTPETLRHHHAGLAIALSLSGHADSETLGAHLEAAGDPVRAASCYEQAAVAAVGVLAFDRAEDLFSRAAGLAVSVEDRAHVYERMIHFYTDMARFNDAYDVGRRAVALFGVRLPARFMPPLFLFDFMKARALLRGRRTHDLLQLRTMTDARLDAAVRLMNAVAKAAYQVRPELCVAVSTKIVNLCLTHGNTRDCAIGYVVFGSIFEGGVLGNHRRGHEFGKLALALVEKYANLQQRSEVHFVVGYFGTSWMRPATEAEALWQVAYETGLAAGDLFHTGCAIASLTTSRYMRGYPLAMIWQESEAFLELLQRFHLREPIGTVTTVRQAIRNLCGLTRDRLSLDDDHFDEVGFTNRLAAFGSRHLAHFYFVTKMQLSYLWGDYERSFTAAAQSATYLSDSRGMLHSTEHYFYNALILAACRKSARSVARTHAKFRKWSMNCPENFAARERILAGSLAHQNGNAARARDLYIQAAELAVQYGQINIEALAWQLTAKLGVTRGLDTADARDHAVDAYNRWGATAYADFVAGRV